MKYGLKVEDNGEKTTYTLGGRMAMVSAGNLGSVGIVGFTPLSEPAPEGKVPKSTEINHDFEMHFTDTKSIDILLQALIMAKLRMMQFEEKDNHVTTEMLMGELEADDGGFWND